MRAWKNKFSKDTAKMEIISLCRYQYVNEKLKAFDDEGCKMYPPSSNRSKMLGSISEGHLCIRLGNR